MARENRSEDWPPKPKEEAMQEETAQTETDVTEGKETATHKTRKERLAARQGGDPAVGQGQSMRDES